MIGVTGSAGHSVLVTGRSGGSVTFGGAIDDHGTGISLTSTTGAVGSTGLVTSAATTGICGEVDVV